VGGKRKGMSDTYLQLISAEQLVHGSERFCPQWTHEPDRLHKREIQRAVKQENEKRKLLLRMTTTAGFEDTPTLAYRGIVTAHLLVKTGFFGNLIERAKDIFQRGQSLRMEGLSEATAAIVKELARQAAQRHANAIVGLRMDCKNVSRYASSLIMLGSGTAVIVRE
jgi:uncharacterized protein YbjQ (UPF0145 family)